MNGEISELGESTKCFPTRVVLRTKIGTRDKLRGRVGNRKQSLAGLSWENCPDQIGADLRGEFAMHTGSGGRERNTSKSEVLSQITESE